MPLKITKQDHAPVCTLSSWEVTDEEILVNALAWLYLRKPIHAARIMKELDPGAAGFPGRVFENAIDLLKYDVSDISGDLVSIDKDVVSGAEKIRDARMALRDGLLFQHVSWIAAALQFPGSISCPPHVRKADKGFDGLLIEVSIDNSNLARLVICEDKASTSPRGLVTSKVWPELELIVSGQKDLELLFAVTALLETVPEVDREAVLIATIWEQLRTFRIAVTAGADQVKSKGYMHLFLGYDERVAGEPTGRMAEVMPMEEVRVYLEELALQVIAKIHDMSLDV